MSLAPFPPTNPYGKSDWRDYVDNWRDADATWLQDRVILRYTDATQRTTDQGASPGIGKVTYNQATDRLELYGKNNAWLSINPLPVNLKVVTDDANVVTLAHIAASPADRGISIGKDNVAITHVLRTQDGVLVADTTGLAIKTGARTVKLTTDGTSLVSDSPVSVPSLIFTGTGNVINTNQPISVGALTAASGSINGVLAVSGALTATATGNTVGGVGLSGTVATAPGGFSSSAGAFYGDANGAIVRQRVAGGGAYGAAYVQVQSANIEVTGGPMNIRSGMTVSDTTISYYSGGAFRGYISPAFYGDPGVSVVPEGSILIQ